MPRFNQKSPQDALDRDAVRRDTLIENLASKTPAEIAAHIEDTVTDVASMKKVIKGLAIAVGYMARKL